MFNKILFFARDSTIPPMAGAGGVFSSGMVFGLMKSGFQVVAMVKQHPNQKTRQLKTSSNPVILRYRRYPRQLAAWFWAREMDQAVSRYRPEIVLMRVPESNFCSNLKPLTRYARALKIPLVAKVNFVPSRWAKGIDNLLDLAHIIICETEGHAKYLPIQFRKKALIITNGFDEGLFDYEKETGLVGNEKCIVMLGTIDKYRNALPVIMAFARSQISHCLKLRIIGSGPQAEEARNLANKLGMSGRVEFLNKISHEKVPAWLKNCYAGIVLPHQESLPFTNPLKLFEFLAMGVPVITRPELAITKRFDPACLRLVGNDLESSLKTCFDNLSFPENIASKCRQTVAPFTWRKIAHSLMNKIEHEITASK